MATCRIDEEKVLNAIAKSSTDDFVNYTRYNKLNNQGYSYQQVWDINWIYKNGSTCLSWAVRKAKVEMIRFILITENTDINKRETGGATPLLLATHLGRFDVVQLFLTKQNLDINCRDSCDATPLIVAVREGHFDIAKLLLDKGADKNLIDINGNSPLSWAIKTKNLEMMELLTEDGETRWTNLTSAATDSNDNVKQAFWAAAYGNIDVVKDFLLKGVDVNVINKKGHTLLGVAVQYRQFELAKSLVELGANVCKFGNNGKPPLLLAILNQDLNMVEFLLNNGAHYMVNIVFLDAIASKKLEIVQLLLTKGASANGGQPRKVQMTPLKKAIEVECFEIAKCLIQRGVDVVEELDKNEILYIINFLEQNNTEMAKLLTENGARLEECEEECGFTVLTKSVQMENFEMVKFLVKKGVNVNKPDKNQLTPLAIAASKHNLQIFQFLVDSGATITEEDETKNVQLAYYYEQAKRNLKIGKDVGNGSNQEEAEL